MAENTTPDAQPSEHPQAAELRLFRRRNQTAHVVATTGKMTSARGVMLACLLSVYAAFVAWGNVIHSPAIDEVAHLPAGLSHLETGRIELYSVNPPLVRLLASLPVKALGPRYDWSRYDPSPDVRAEFPVATDFVRANSLASPKYYSVARFGVLPFYLVGAVVCFMFSKSVSACGLCGAAFWVLNPTVLGHSSMITPDVGAAVAGITFAFLAASQPDLWSWKSVFVCGLAAGYVMCTKSTWIIVLPLLAVLPILWSPGTLSTLRCRLVRSLAGLCVAAVIVNSMYGFHGAFPRLGDCHFGSKSLTIAGASPAFDRVNRFSGTLAGQLILPLPQSLVEGIDIQKCDFERGYRSYLLGEWKHGGWWYYYLIGFLVKEPVGFQAMLYFSVLNALWRWRRWTKDSIRKWSVIVVPPLLIFGLVSSQTGFNHHMRYVLPAYPFLFIIAARTVTLGRFWKWFSYGCLTWQTAAVLWFAPHWMSYFNEAAGGPMNGHKWLVDSNIDWGQDILMLKCWQDQHPEAEPLNAAIFTMFDPADIGLRFQTPAPYVKGCPGIVSKHGLRGPQPGWFAISVCMLKGMHYSVPDGDGEWSWSTENFTYFLENFEPVDRIGYSIYIYHISEADAARVREKLLAEEAEFIQAAK